MQTEFVNSFEKWARASLDSAKRLAEIQVRTAEKLTERQLSAANDYIETGVKQVSLMSDPRDAEGMVGGQVQFVTELNAKFVDNARMTAEIFNQAREDMTAWMQDGAEAMQASAPVKKAAAKKAA